VSCLFLGPDGPTDGVSLLKKGTHYPNCDVAVCARDQDLAGGLNCRHDVGSVMGIDKVGIQLHHMLYTSEWHKISIPVHDQ
jgi:hypothetical protein